MLQFVSTCVRYATDGHDGMDRDGREALGGRWWTCGLQYQWGDIRLRALTVSWWAGCVGARHIFHPHQGIPAP